ncbi:hypothetical protein [Streptomyces sp. enrichment culture]|uniref:hypothetical protein n=1 Tax=Streptomyces sp. enrichment culture TaxID=1795815 RepID=UPI003F552002
MRTTVDLAAQHGMTSKGCTNVKTLAEPGFPRPISSPEARTLLWDVEQVDAPSRASRCPSGRTRTTTRYRATLGAADRRRRGAANFDAKALRRRFGAGLDKLTADFGFVRVGMLQETAEAKKNPRRPCRHPHRHRHRRRRLRQDGGGRGRRGTLRSDLPPQTSGW